MIQWIFVVFALSSSVYGDWKSDVVTFRKENESELKKNWLVVVGLFWLREGENTLGKASSSFIHLPEGTPDVLGKIHLRTGKAEIEFTTVENVKLDGQPVVVGKRYPLKTDQVADKTVVDVNNVQFYLLQRPNGIGLRVKDANSETLQKFKGLQWFEPQQKYVIEGKWKEISPAKVLKVPDILGNIYDEKINGSVEFTFNKKNYELFPTRKGDDVFFVFKDATSGRTTYGTGRFLEAKVDKEGKVILDFNRAYSPPCAHIRYATCPMAPEDNMLGFAVDAGEKGVGHGPRAQKSGHRRRRRH